MSGKSSKIIQLIWIVVMVAVVASTASLLIAGHGEGPRWVTEEEYQRIKRYERLDRIRGTLMNEFYQPLDEDALMLGAIRGMTSAADDVYTFYYTPEDMKRENEDSEGRYEGVGIQVERNQEGYVEVVRVYPGTPAEAAGLEMGDRIVTVDGEEIDRATFAGYLEGVQRMRGTVDTEVRLGVLRGERTLEFVVARTDIQISYVDYAVIDGDIGYVAISQFTGDAAERFQEALDAFRAQGVSGIVIDVRNNPGGLLTEVNKIADSVLPKGVIVYIQDRNGTRTDYYSDEACYDVPLAVLVNDMSASASEILAASVQALDRGVVVGLTTYGKGVVQTMTTYPEDGAGLQYTTASYYDANGRSINGVGVVPDVEVALEGDRVPVEPDPEHDNQLAAAIEVLRGNEASGSSHTADAA